MIHCTHCSLDVLAMYVPAPIPRSHRSITVIRIKLQQIYTRAHVSYQRYSPEPASQQQRSIHSISLCPRIGHLFLNFSIGWRRQPYLEWNDDIFFFLLSYRFVIVVGWFYFPLSLSLTLFLLLLLLPVARAQYALLPLPCRAVPVPLPPSKRNTITLPYIFRFICTDIHSCSVQLAFVVLCHCFFFRCVFCLFCLLCVCDVCASALLRCAECALASIHCYYFKIGHVSLSQSSYLRQKQAKQQSQQRHPWRQQQQQK